MKNIKELTVLIVTYNTDKNILVNCLKSIDKRVKVLIVENSNKFKYSKDIKKFKNISYVCSGKNLGYGKGNNFGLKKINTKYALILNPDILCDKHLFKNISILISKKINFHLIGCQYLKDKIFMPAGFFDKEKNINFRKNFKKNNQNYLNKVDWVTGCSMLVNISKFNNKNIFDKNFFLYFEEFDLCKRIINKGGNIYTCKDLRIHHLGFKSSLGVNLNNEFNANNLREWHWMWSSFYFYKKHYGYIYSFFKLFGKFIKSLLKLFYYSLTFNQKLSNKYKFRFHGLLNSFLNRPAFFKK